MRAKLINAGLALVALFAVAHYAEYWGRITDHASAESMFKTKSELRYIDLCYAEFKEENGRPASNWEELLAFIALLPVDPHSDTRERLRGKVDAWGREIQLSTGANGRLDARSSGPNGQFGDGDDLLWSSAGIP